MNTLRALPGYVLLEILKEESEQGGFRLPESAGAKPAKGVVIDGQEFIDDGKTVRFRRYSGQEFTENGKNLLLIKEDEVMGVYEES